MLKASRERFVTHSCFSGVSGMFEKNLTFILTPPRL